MDPHESPQSESGSLKSYIFTSVKIFIYACSVVALLIAWTQLVPKSAPSLLVKGFDAVLPSFGNAADKSPLKLAVAVDSETPQGLAVIQGVELYLEDFNKEGGISGHPVVLEVFDDGTDANTAIEAAKAASASSALAVIGHRTSGKTLAAVPIYNDEKIVSISPTATSPKLADISDWFYRVIEDDKKSSEFLVEYLNTVDHPDDIFILAEDGEYGGTIAEQIHETAIHAGLHIEPTLHFSPEATVDSPAIRNFIAEIKSTGGHKAVFLAAYPELAVQIVRAIRESRVDDVLIMGLDSLDTPVFINGFDGLDLEHEYPGFYTDGILIATPLLFDTAGRKAGKFRAEYQYTYGEVPDWRAAFSYDAAAVAVTAMDRFLRKNPSIDPAQASEKVQIRKGIQEEIAAIRVGIQHEVKEMHDTVTGIESLTGPLFFDHHGEAPRPPALATMHDGHLVSHLSQFRISEVRDSEKHVQKMQEEGRIINLEGVLLQRSTVAFTGIHFENINHIDTQHNTAHINGHIWFRHSPDDDDLHVSPGDISFVNKYDDEIAYERVEKYITDDNIEYELYNFSGTFLMDFVPGLHRFGEPTLGIQFHHRTEAASVISYVVDTTGMGLNAHSGNKVLFEHLEPELEAEGWLIDDVYAYKEPTWVSSKGTPEHLKVDDGVLAHAGFVSFAHLAPSNSFVAVIFSHTDFAPYFLIAAAIFLISVPWRIFLSERTGELLPLVVQFVSLMLALMALDHLIIQSIQDKVPLSQVALVAKTMSILFWILPAYYLLKFMDLVFWKSIESKMSGKVPGLLRHMDKAIIYTVVTLVVMSTEFGIPVTQILAATGVIGLVVGLALQGNLANIVTGLVLTMERPFKVGDVIRINGGSPRLVTDMTWRSVRMKAGPTYERSIPNSDIGNADITKLTGHLPAACVPMIKLPVQIPKDLVVSKIKEILKTLGTLYQDKPQEVYISGVSCNDRVWVTEYTLYFYSEFPHEQFRILRPLWAKLLEELGPEMLEFMKQPGSLSYDTSIIEGELTPDADA